MVDDDDWQLGEDVVERRFFPSGALRDMADPNNGGTRSDFFWQPAHMDEFVDLDISQDNGGVHINSGIPNRACFLIAEAVGREKTAQLYYHILDARYLNSRARFIDMRLAALQAAADLFGDSSFEVTAVAAAFDQVGIIDAAGSQAPQDIAVVEGEEWVAIINAEASDRSLYLVRPALETADDIHLLTSTQVFTETGNPISVAADGSFLLFIDADNFVRAINSDGSGEEVISTEGEWASLALSPDGSKLAATTVFEDSTIFVFDLLAGEKSTAIKLYNPTTQSGITANIVRYADALDWDLSSSYLVYDAFNSIKTVSGDSLGYWDINLLDVENELILPLFATLPEGLHMGNPSFAQTNDNFITFDLLDGKNATNEVWVANLFEREVGFIESTGSSIAFPRFSSDYRHLAFALVVDDVSTVRQIALDPSRMQAIGPSEPYPVYC
jgi:hypothetical protein